MPIQSSCPTCGANVSVPVGLAGQAAPVAIASGDPWSTIRVGLAVVQAGTILGTISVLCLAGAIGLAAATWPQELYVPGTLRLCEAPVYLRYGLPFFEVLGAASAFAACVVTLTGWSVCLAGAERSLKAIIGAAVATFAVALACTLLLVSYENTRMPLKWSFIGKGEGVSPREIWHSDNWCAFFLLVTVGAVAAACALYAGFLRGIANRTGNRRLSVETRRYAVFVIAVVAWALISLIAPGLAAWQPSGVWSALLKAIGDVFQSISPYNTWAILVAMAFHFLWLRSLTAQAGRALCGAS